MAFSTIARKKAAPLAALIRKLALNDARVIQAASIQATRSFNTKAMGAPRVFEPIYESFSEPDYLNGTEDFTSAAGAPAAVPLSKRCGFYEDEDENRYEIRMDMPGLGKEHVKLLLYTEPNTLVIKGDGGEEKGARKYSRDVKLIGIYKLNEIDAEMKNGILKIVVPAVKEEEMLQINVK